MKSTKSNHIKLYIITFLCIFIVLSHIVISDNIVENQFNLSHRLLPPGSSHILGTDVLGRDLRLVLIIGLRNSLTAALISIIISLILCFILSIISTLSKFISQIVDYIVILINVIPSIFVVALISTIFSTGVHNIVLAIILTTLPMYYRIIKTIIKMVFTQPYIEFLRVISAPTIYIMIQYVFKEIFRYVITLALFSIPIAIAIEISLNFIGFGLNLSALYLGNIIAEGIRYYMVAPHILVASTIFTILIIILLAVALNFANETTYE